VSGKRRPLQAYLALFAAIVDPDIGDLWQFGPGDGAEVARTLDLSSNQTSVS
jgi:hypothetical protein